MGPNYGVKTVLNPRQHLRVPLEDVHNIAIRLLDYVEVSGKLFCPSREASTMVWGPEKYNPACGAKYVSEVCPVASSQLPKPAQQ